jgi:hypothetical protein
MKVSVVLKYINSIRLFSVIDTIDKYARVFVPKENFQPSLIFVSEVKTYSSEHGGF